VAGGLLRVPKFRSLTRIVRETGGSFVDAKGGSGVQFQEPRFNGRWWRCWWWWWFGDEHGTHRRHSFVHLQHCRLRYNRHAAGGLLKVPTSLKLTGVVQKSSGRFVDVDATGGSGVAPLVPKILWHGHDARGPVAAPNRFI